LQKNDIFVLRVKKDKEISCEKLFKSLKFVFFAHDTKNIDFPGTTL
jgi:hypothetical protein